jgi:3'-phosphoadenosine 5'-phosphosulfate sulfotransferase (PAPS reductase)/FAD synthetase
MSAYKLPDGNVQIAFSGGRSSAYMLHHILEANGGLRDGSVVCFQNTGREMPQTLDFIQECGHRWNVQIVWLEYDGAGEKPSYKTVSHNSAARDGKPFEELIRRKKYLPNQQARFCTIELKIRTGKRYLMQALGWKEWTNAIGIRADEPKRIRPETDKNKDRWFTWQPLNHANVTRHMVVEWWRKQPFDLGLEVVNGNSALGNCDGCFLKSEATLAMLARDYPDRHDWWQEMEGLASSLCASPLGARFRKEFTRQELGSFVARQGDWIFNDKAALCQEDFGECTE